MFGPPTTATASSTNMQGVKDLESEVRLIRPHLQNQQNNTKEAATTNCSFHFVANFTLGFRWTFCFGACPEEVLKNHFNRESHGK